MKQTLWFFLLLAMPASFVLAQNYSIKSSVQLSTEVTANPPRITLRWLKDPDATVYSVFRKAKTATSWGGALASLPKDSTSYVDMNVEVGKTYEYRVAKSSAIVPGSGYVFSGINVPAQEWKGSILLLVDSTVSKQLGPEIDTWKSDLGNEGWNVLQFVPGTRQTVVEIRAKIADFKRIQPDLKSVFILGHVKVPYSGNLNPDGHPDHMGAWPSDTYYADIDGLWTDITEDNSVASRQANKNVPGDGKFDQSVIPSDADLEVGRVDFYDMPAFSKTEIQLLRNYLNKNHLWRTGQIKAERRGIVQDNFNFQNEAFGQSGIKNFNTFFGPNNVYYESYRDSLIKKSYLWSFGAGGGNYSGASGISSTGNMVTDSLQTVFTFLFGSYFGDWDSQNNFLKSALGSGTVLTDAWSGRPLWAVHHMGLGEHIGYSTRLTMNNSSTYTAGYGARGVHIALMGDPSLSMFPWKGSATLDLVESGPHVDLKWRTVAEATEGYTVYRKTEGNTAFDVLARNVKDTIYRDKCLYPGFKYEYMVRASKLETTPSGSFYNLSSGIRNSLSKTAALTPKADFDYTLDYEFLHLKSKSKNSNSVFSGKNQAVKINSA